MQRGVRLAAVGVVVALSVALVQAQEKAGEGAAAALKAPAVAAAKPAAGGAVSEKPVAVKEDINPLLLKFQQGGMTMWFLTALSLAGVAFAIDRAMQLRRKNAVPDGLAEKVDGMWKAGQFAPIREECRSAPSTLARVVDFVVEHRNSDLPALNEGIGDIVRREFRKHNRRAYPLAIVGTLSPLLGLLGTVVGLLEAFEAVAVAGTMDDPSILANSIAKALITTVYGLLIAIPALVAYHFFKTRTGDLLDVLDEEVADLMNGWYLKK